MATCIGGVTVGFISCWQISLLTLATGPFIVAAGVISNIALTRLADHVHDSYSEAAGIAEQVCCTDYLFFLEKRGYEALYTVIGSSCQWKNVRINVLHLVNSCLF